MTKLIKKVQLNTEQNETLQSADSTKGTVTNPFTEEGMLSASKIYMTLIHCSGAKGNWKRSCSHGL